MKTLLLLAGRSRRFWPLQEKSLFPILGKPLLAQQIDRLCAGGLTDITLVGGKHNLKEVSTLFPALPVIEQEDLEMGMQGALLSALPHCGSDPVVIVSGNDVIEPAAYRSIITAMEEDPSADGAILAKRTTTYFPGGYLTVENDRITAIVEKPGAGKEPSDLVTIVAHAHRDASVLLAALKSAMSVNDDGYERALAALFKDHVYRAVPYSGSWLPLKYPWHLLPLLEHMLSSIDRSWIDPSANLHPSAVIQGNVILGKNVRVFPHASIVGPCYIGEGTIVANNALVRSSSIGNNCVVGYSTEVKGSLLCDNVWSHMSYIGDSVIGSNVSFGAGFVTGNLRLDEAEIGSDVGGERTPTGLAKFGAAIGSDSRVGIHVGTNPGIKIGSGTFIGSGVLVDRDIPDRSFVTMKQGEVSIVPNRSTVAQPESREVYRGKI